MSDLVPDEAWTAVVEANPIQAVVSAKGSAWDINELQERAVEASAPFIRAGLAGELLDGLDESLCAFWACDGPDVEPVPMKTCRVCSLIWRLRQLAEPLRASVLRGEGDPK